MKGEVKDFWEKEALKIAEQKQGAHSDPFLVELEDWFVISALEKFKPHNLLDVGCGNGQRTIKFSKDVSGTTIGIDYTENMIRFAKKYETSTLQFKVANVLEKPPFNEKFDCVASCRCLINLENMENVLSALQYFYEILNPEGILIMCEVSAQGHDRLNKLRKSVGLKPIETVWHNINLDEEVVFKYLENKFLILEKTHFGLYYAITRVLHPALIMPEEPSPTAKINEIAMKMQKHVGYNESDEFGRQLAILAKKKS